MMDYGNVSYFDYDTDILTGGPFNPASVAYVACWHSLSGYGALLQIFIMAVGIPSNAYYSCT